MMSRRQKSLIAINSGMTKNWQTQNTERAYRGLSKRANVARYGIKLPATRIFSPLTVAGLCVTIGRYWYLFKRLTALSTARFYRFEHIDTYSSGKVVAKSDRAHPYIAREEQPFEV